MKRNLIIFSIAAVFLTGCGSAETEKETVETQEVEETNSLETTLIEYGKDMYKNNIEGYLIYPEGEYTQTVTIDQLKQLDYDMTDFENYNCNIIETKVDIIMNFNSEGKVTSEPNYEVTLSCELGE